MRGNSVACGRAFIQLEANICIIYNAYYASLLGFYYGFLLLVLGAIVTGEILRFLVWFLGVITSDD